MKALTTLVASLLLVSAGSAQGVEVLRWKKKYHAYDALPEELPAAARSAIESWIPWARKHSYRMALEDEGRALLLAHEDNARWKRQARLVDESVEFFEEALPYPTEVPDTTEASSPTPSETPADDTDELPEDPDGAPVPWELGGKPSVQTEEPETFSTTWGAESLTPDSQTAVFLVARTPRHYYSALSHLADTHTYLASWEKEAREFTGCTLQQPLFGTYVELNNGQEEWNPDNELVHRMAELLLLRRYGQQPYWLVQAWAWRAEFAIQKAVYCFPYRNEFVSAGEHTGWHGIVKNRLNGRKKSKTPLSMRDFARWKRGTYDDVLAKNAWGVLDFVAKENPGGLAQLLVAYRDIRDRENRVSKGDGQWERRRSYEVPLDKQEKHFKSIFGEDVLDEATKALLGKKR